VNLIWMPAALADRAEIFEYIEADNPAAAEAVDERIESAAERLVDFPKSGRPGRVAGTRELIAGGTSYILPYRIERDEVRILRVIHAARLWPEDIPGKD
jgi:addiction module RelE/StbE family toxin